MLLVTLMIWYVVMCVFNTRVPYCYYRWLYIFSVPLFIHQMSEWHQTLLLRITYDVSLSYLSVSLSPVLWYMYKTDPNYVLSVKLTMSTSDVI